MTASLTSGISSICVGSIFICSPSTSTSHFNSSNNIARASTSEISGTPNISTGPSDNTAAGINATVAFFAPLILTVPFNLYPPSIAITSDIDFFPFSLINI